MRGEEESDIMAIVILYRVQSEQPTEMAGPLIKHNQRAPSLLLSISIHDTPHKHMESVFDFYETC